MNDKRSLWNAPLLLALLAVAGPAIIRIVSQGLWWDEAVYLGLAQALRQGHYTLEPGAAVESFRPPVFPLLLFMLGGNETIARIFAGLSTVAALLLMGRSDDKAHDPFPTTLLLALCVPGFIFIGCKILSEATFVILSTAALLSMRRAEAGHGLRWSALAGVLLGLTLLTRYFGFLTIGCTALALLLVLLAQRKGGWAALATLAGLGVTLIPFALMGLRAFGTPFGAFGAYRSMYRLPNLTGLARGFWHIGLSVNVLLPLMGLALLALAKDWRRARASDFLLALLATSSLVLYILSPHKEPRYLVAFVWTYVALAALGFHSLRDRLARPARLVQPGLITVAIMGVGATCILTAQDANVGSPTIQAARYLNRVSAPGDKILTTSRPFAYYGAQRLPVFEPQQDALIAFMRERGADYVLLDKFEAKNPPFLNGFFDRHPESFEKLRAFPGRGMPEAAVVYRLRPTD